MNWDRVEITIMAIVFVLSILLAGCASGYGKFYESRSGATAEAIAAGRAAPPPKEPRIERSDQAPRAIVATYERYGFKAIGHSSFSSGRVEPEIGAAKQGARIGADLVVVTSPIFAGATTTTIPITIPTQQTSHTQSTVHTFGSGGGFATAFGTSTTTTRGSQTTYVPVTVHRYDYLAIYFVNWRYVFGAMWRDLTQEERRLVRFDAGVYVTEVVFDTPAYYYTVLPGDIILAVNDQSPMSADDFGALINRYKGETVKLMIMRGEELMWKDVRIRD